MVHFYIIFLFFLFFRAVAEAIENAREVVFIEDWWLVNFIIAVVYKEMSLIFYYYIVA